MNAPTPDTFQETLSRRHDNLEAEQAVVGLLLIDRQSAPEILAACSPDDFAHAPHPRIMEVCKALHDDGMTISPLTVKAKLGSDLDEIGGQKYLASLAKSAPLSESAGHLASIVSDLAMRRKADEVLEAGRDHLLRHDRPLVECLGDVIETTSEAIDRSLRRHGHLSTAESADEVLKLAEASMNGDLPPSIKTKLVKFDYLSNGFHPSDFVVIAGRPSMGKTCLLTNIARAASEANIPTLFLSLETSQHDITRRLLADISYGPVARQNGEAAPLPYAQFRGRLNDTQFNAAYEARKQLREFDKLEIRDAAGMSVHDITAVAERFAAKFQTLGLFVVDYLQLVDAGNRYKGNRVNEVSEISAALKRLAMRTNWCVLAASQINRGVEGRDDKRPQLSDLRESGSIEQDADVVASVYRKAYYVHQKQPEHSESDPGWATWNAEYDAVKHDISIALLKNRNGARGSVSCHFDLESGAVRNHAEDAPAVEYREGYVR